MDNCFLFLFSVVCSGFRIGGSFDQKTDLGSAALLFVSAEHFLVRISSISTRLRSLLHFSAVNFFSLIVFLLARLVSVGFGFFRSAFLPPLYPIIQFRRRGYIIMCIERVAVGVYSCFWEMTSGEWMVSWMRKPLIVLVLLDIRGTGPFLFILFC